MILDYFLKTSYYYLNARDEDNRTCLHLAVLSGSVPMVQRLVQQNMNLNQKDIKQKTPLHYAIEGKSCDSGEIALVLLSKGANFNIQDIHKDYPLHSAVKHSKLHVIEYLIDAGADLNVTNENSQTPLHYSLERDTRNRQEIFFLLLSYGANVNLIDIHGNCPLHLAAKHCNRVTIQYLLNAGASQDVTNAKKQTPLHVFVTAHDDSSITELLIGKNIDAVDALSRSALHLAAIQGFHLNVTTLIEHGANPVLRDSSGGLPFSYGCQSGSIKCVNLINDILDGSLSISKLTSKSLQNTHTESLMRAIQNKDIFEVMILTRFLADVNFCDKNEQTPLHLAAVNDHYEIIKILMECKANPNLKNKDGQTPIHLVAHCGGVESMKCLLSNENADVQEKDNFWQTPLHLAADNDDYEIIQLLMERKSNPNFKNMRGQTPIHLVAHHGGIDSMKLLLNY